MRNLLDTALKQLSGHNCSELELRRHLEKEFNDLPQLDKEIDAILLHLHKLHLVNDMRVADTMAQSYYHSSNRFISQVLRQKGISEKIIEQTLAVNGDEKERALEASKRKLYILKGSVKMTETDLICFLSSCGFLTESIYQTIHQLQADGIL